jgi:flagellar operon protein
MGFRIINGVSYPVGNFPINNNYSKQNVKGNDTSTAVSESTKTTAAGIKSFKDILGETAKINDGFTISNHAAERMENLKLDSKDLDKINDAINKAEDKGAKNCLIVYKEVAMVTSIENRTVITAVQGSRAKENVFTNIDSVVLL